MIPVLIVFAVFIILPLPGIFSQLFYFYSVHPEIALAVKENRQGKRCRFGRRFQHSSDRRPFLNLLLECAPEPDIFLYRRYILPGRIKKIDAN
jgi:hypothetical protein